MRMIALMVCLVSIAATAMEQTVQELPFLTTDIYVNIIDQLMPERRFGNSEEIKSFGKIWKVWSCVNKSLNKYLSQEDTRLDVMQKLGKEGQLNIWTAEVIGFKEIKTHLEYLYNTAQRTPLLLKTEDIRHSFYANLDHLLYHYINSGILEVIERFLACKKVEDFVIYSEIHCLIDARDMVKSFTNERILRDRLIIENLLNYMQNVDYRKNITVNTLLMYAIQNKDDAVAYRLLQKGANPQFYRIRGPFERGKDIRSIIERGEYKIEGIEYKRLVKEENTDIYKTIDESDSYRINTFGCAKEKGMKLILQNLIELVNKEREQLNS